MRMSDIENSLFSRHTAVFWCIVSLNDHMRLQNMHFPCRTRVEFLVPNLSEWTGSMR